MKKMNSTPTMKDVAKEAGVSLGTVSKVVNGIEVGRIYKDKVNAAIKKLDYKVNNYAQGMKTNKTKTVAFIVPDTLNPFFAELTYHINSVLAKRGYRMLLCATQGDTAFEQSYINMAAQNKIDGLICLSYNEELVIPENIPLVMIDRHINASAPCVASDNFAGGQLAAKKLEELGCKHIAYMMTGSRLPNEPTKRGDGFITYCVTHNMKYDILNIYDDEPFSMVNDFLEKHIHKGKSDIDGLFCVNDTLAVRIIEILKTMSIRVPEDIQIIGYDGIKNFITGRYNCSTIIQPLEQIAVTSVDMILSKDWSALPHMIYLPVTYAAGGTTREPME